MTLRELMTRIREGVAVSTEQIALAVNGDASALSRRDVDTDLRRSGATPIHAVGDNYWSADDVRRYLDLRPNAARVAEPSDAA